MGRDLKIEIYKRRNIERDRKEKYKNQIIDN